MSAHGVWDDMAVCVFKPFGAVLLLRYESGQVPVDVVALTEAAEALGLAAGTVETIADQFAERLSVSWSDVRAVSVAGRDIARLRQHMSGQVRR